MRVMGAPHLRITFVLPMFLPTPAGGFKVVYEYANRLHRRGHKVAVVHPRSLVESGEHGWIDAGKQWLWPWKLRWRHRPLVPWFPVDPGVRLLLTPDLREERIPDGDVIVATAFQTAFPVAQYGAEKGRGYYLIQSYEDWMGEEEEVRKSWQLPLQKIVVSRWLERRAHELGEGVRTVRIPPGLDREEFRLREVIQRRRRPRVGMLAHPLTIKGTRDGVTALGLVRQRIPNLEAVLFGTTSRPLDLPEWIEYRQSPSPTALVALYNECQVFLHPSHLEGWGLPAVEAMACGCALVAAHNEGVDDFAEDGVTARLVPIRSPERLAEALEQLLTEEALRHRLAEAGLRKVAEFDWSTTVDQMERTLHL
jgi:glycosyltransferase involved in cell wall biosynthesis